MNKWIMLAACIVALISLAGCEARSRYKAMSFFFDGVPDPDKAVVVAQNTNNNQSNPRQRKQKNLGHGPFEARLCTACHRPGTNTLIMPVEELCFNCHNLNMKKKYVHGPVAAGGCRVCHEPHGSGRPFLLTSEPQKFCFYCHDEKRVMAKDVHQGIEAACTACHDAHSSDSRFMLK